MRNKKQVEKTRKENFLKWEAKRKRGVEAFARVLRITKKNRMNVNEINLAKTTRVEGDTDAYHILSNQFQLDQYIARFGNVEVVYDAEWKVYRVPSLDAKRNLYCEAKAIDCARWGSE